MREISRQRGIERESQCLNRELKMKFRSRCVSIVVLSKSKIRPIESILENIIGIDQIFFAIEEFLL